VQDLFASALRCGSTVLSFSTLALLTLLSHVLGAEPGDQEGREIQGPYTLEFRGNKALDASELRRTAVEDITDFERLRDKASIDDAAFEMELAYRRAGYPFAAVDYSLEGTTDHPTVTFHVMEGPQVMVGAIRIEGNTVFATDVLSSFFFPGQGGLVGKGRRFFVESEVRSAIDAIRDLYYSHGFLDILIEGPRLVFNSDRSRVDIEVLIREGPQYTLKEVVFEGDVLPATEGALSELSAELRKGPYVTRKELILRSRIREIYGNMGYPDTRVEVVQKKDGLTGGVFLNAKISSGEPVRISAIAVSGNLRTRDSFIRSRLRLHPGDTYAASKERKSFDELYGTGLFTRVDLALRDRGVPGERELAVDLEEAPSLEFFFEPGWGSYELLRLRTGVRKKNLRGQGRILNAEAGWSVKSRNVLASLTDPWFLNTGISANFPAFYRYREETSFTRKEVGVSSLFSTRFTRDLTATLGYQYRIATVSRLDITPEAAQEIGEGYNLGSVLLQVAHDSRDDLFLPTAGWRAAISLEAADAVLGSGLAFYRFNGSMRWFRKITGATVLGVRYDTGLILPGRNERNVPLGERFFNGGENTVRSFRESELGPVDSDANQVGGLAFNVVSLELRRKIADNLIAALFLDLGNVSPNRPLAEDDQREIRPELISRTFRDYFRDFRAGIGMGLNYLLPVGPVRLDVAFNPSPGDNPREARARVHFSVGMAF